MIGPGRSSLARFGGSVLPALLLAAHTSSAQVLELTPGQTVQGFLPIVRNPDAASFVSYVFDVDDNVVALSIELEASTDLDLYLDTDYIEDYGDVLASSTGLTGAERLDFDLGSDAGSIADEYYIDVTYGRVEPPVDARGERIGRIPFKLKVTPYRQRIDATIDAGTVVTGRIDPRGSGPFRTYVIDVPNGTPRLRVDLASDATDLDLRVRHRKPMRTSLDADARAVSWAGSETVVIDNDGEPIAAGRYYIDVFDQAWLDWPAEFRLVATFGDAPPTDLVELPTLAAGGGLAGAVSSTVEILHDDGGGTGVLLSDTGYILTNYHVVENVAESGAAEGEDLLVGLTVDPSEGSHIRLRGRIVAVDRDGDLALLHAATDFYGNPLPENYRFPAMLRGDPGLLALGDPLFVIGYPDAGSLGTRVSITVTRGIVSGFERRGDKVVIKTDSDIASGNSGGPVLNDRFELIGIATEAISEQFGNSQVGYIWPLWLVPNEWWKLAGIGD